MLMCEVSKSVKETLQSTIGVVNTASFHAFVCSQTDSSSGHVTQQVPAEPGSLLQQTPSDLLGAEMSTFKAVTSSGIAIQRMSLPNRLSLHQLDPFVVSGVAENFVLRAHPANDVRCKRSGTCYNQVSHLHRLKQMNVNNATTQPFCGIF